MGCHECCCPGYRLSKDFKSVLAGLGAKYILIQPRHPRQNGKAEWFNRTLQEGWAYRHVFDSNQARTDALQPWLDFYNHQRPTATSEAKHPSPCVNNLLSEYS